MGSSKVARATGLKNDKESIEGTMGTKEEVNTEKYINIAQAFLGSEGGIDLGSQ